MCEMSSLIGAHATEVFFVTECKLKGYVTEKKLNRCRGVADNVDICLYLNQRISSSINTREPRKCY